MSDAAEPTLPPGVHITFPQGESSAEHRYAAIRTVAALHARAEQAAAQAEAETAREAALMQAVNAPLLKAIESDPAAAKALAELRAPALIDFTTDDEPAPRVLARPPPFDFGWNWHHGAAPHRMIVNNDTGRLSLYGRSVGSGGSSNIHAGFGLILRTDRPVTATGWSTRRMAIKWQVGAVGLSAFAVSEGGMEFTALENGRLIASASSKLWRRRVSGPSTEEARGDVPAFDVQDPRSLSFSMRPGFEYTFNVGVWVVVDRSTGLSGDALCQGLIDGSVANIAITR